MKKRHIKKIIKEESGNCYVPIPRELGSRKNLLEILQICRNLNGPEVFIFETEEEARGHMKGYKQGKP
jgi:hypothetical protein